MCWGGSRAGNHSLELLRCPGLCPRHCSITCKVEEGTRPGLGGCRGALLCAALLPGCSQPWALSLRPAARPRVVLDSRPGCRPGWRQGRGLEERETSAGEEQGLSLQHHLKRERGEEGRAGTRGWEEAELCTLWHGTAALQPRAGKQESLWVGVTQGSPAPQS